ncbi:MAG: RraA family protein [Rhodospirillaceae bacterium]|jgi:4-hydroxy-4-methyl-2-oxoglutarate aldolase|nr:RraA family protein [Rhodospirillaceae bacterium]MBT6137963.1 RraA family protein [Rhodospirillaceae bacterium]
MPMIRHTYQYDTLGPAEMERWRQIPAAVAGDCLNRTNCMAGAVKPLSPEMRLTGHARTLRTMVGDNGPVHAGIPLMEAGEIIVIATGGYSDTAIIGGILTTAAKHKGVAGFVLDGPVRDVTELKEMGLPVFCAGAVPAGPHKGFGGEIDGPIACGGVVVRPGDVILGDEDGVTVVPLERAADTLLQAEALLAKEASTLEALAEGKTTAEMLGIAIPGPGETV